MDSTKNAHPNIISIPGVSTPDPRGVGYVYYHTMLKHGEKIAQTNASTNQQESYQALLKRCVRTAIGMQRRGIKPGDFVSLCTPTDLDTCVPYIASYFIGAITASVDPTMSVQEIVYLLKQAKPKMIFVSKDAVSLIEEVVRELQIEITIVVFGESEIYIPFSEFLDPAPNENEFKPREVDNLKELALVIFSSGTSGRPKGICHTHFSILSSTGPPYHGGATFCTFCTIYWSVLHMFIHTCIINGFEQLIFDKFDATNPWEILNFKIDLTLLTPLSAMAFTKYEKPSHIKLENLRTLLVGGFSISTSDLSKLKACLNKSVVLSVYGQTEAFRAVFGFPMNQEGQKLAIQYPDSVGCPVPGVSYKIVDLETEEILGPNKRGELRVKTDFQSTGYFNQDYTEMFDSDGWLKTGDLAYYNDDRCFFIIDRIKESFKYKGYHISPVEIETVLLTHPSIKQAIVMGLPHASEANHPIAIVVLNENCNIAPEEIVKYVDERVDDKNRLRGGVEIVESIPMTATNKYNRFKLRQILNIN